MRRILFFLISGFSLANHSIGNETSISKKHVTLEEDIFIKNAPYIAIVEKTEAFRRDRHSTAIIITNRFLLSSSKYLDVTNPSKVRVVTGVTKLMESGGLNRHYIQRIYYPRYYSIRDEMFDICLIQLKDEICFNYFQRPIALLTKEHLSNLRLDVDLNQLKIVGYGKKLISSPKFLSCMGDLKMKKLLIINETIDFSRPTFKLGSGFFTCSGDIGTPAILYDKLAGIVSEGPTCDNKTCEGIFTGIIYSSNWIKKVVGEENLRQASNVAFREISNE